MTRPPRSPLFVLSQLILGCVLALGPSEHHPSTASASQDSWPTTGWSRSAPREQGLDPAPLAELDRRIRDGVFGYVDRVVVTRGDRLRVIHSLEAADHVVAADLLFVECDRALIRLVALGALPQRQAKSAAQQLARASEHWQALRLSPSILERSRQPFPVEPLRALDALHLASALAARSVLPEIAVLSLDRRIRDNAGQLGFVV